MAKLESLRMRGNLSVVLGCDISSTWSHSSLPIRAHNVLKPNGT